MAAAGNIRWPYPSNCGPSWGKTAFVKYIPRMSRRQAAALAQGYAQSDRAKRSVCRGLTDTQIKEMAEGGGLEALLEPEWSLGGPEQYKPLTSEDRKRESLQGKAYLLALRINQAKRNADPETPSWDKLYSEWVRIKEPKRPRDAKATIGLLRHFFGDVDCKDINQQDIGRFREHLGAKGASRITIKQRLGHVHAMYVAAINEPTSPFAGMPNPAAGIGLLGRKQARRSGVDRAFTGAQVCKILEQAAAVKFGRKRHEQIYGC